MNKIGPSTEPCGTPSLCLAGMEDSLLIIMLIIGNEVREARIGVWCDECLVVLMDCISSCVSLCRLLFTSIASV